MVLIDAILTCPFPRPFPCPCPFPCLCWAGLCCAGLCWLHSPRLRLQYFPHSIGLRLHALRLLGRSRVNKLLWIIWHPRWTSATLAWMQWSEYSAFRSSRNRGPTANNNLLKALLLHGQRLSRREPQLCYLNPENRHQEASVDTASLNLGLKLSGSQMSSQGSGTFFRHFP